MAYLAPCVSNNLKKLSRASTSLAPKRSSLIADLDAFLAEMEKPVGRDDQLNQLRACYDGHDRSIWPLHVWCYGPSGAGKTLCIRYLLSSTIPRAGLVPIYISCRERFTLLDMVEQILDAGEHIRDPQRTRDHQLQLLRAQLRERRCVIVLDDIHVLRPSDMADLLQHLCTVPTVSLLCVAASRDPLAQLPEALLSRLVPRQVFFPSYGREDLLSILRRTAERALRRGAWHASALDAVAEQARGDARRAVALLRHAVQRAEEEGAASLQPEHLRPENFDHFSPRVEEELALLSAHHRILYDVVAAKGPISATLLDAEYRALCTGLALAPVASRTLNKYLNVLCLRRLLHREFGAGGGAWIYRLPGSTSNALAR